MTVKGMGFFMFLESVKVELTAKVKQ